MTSDEMTLIDAAMERASPVDRTTPPAPPVSAPVAATTPQTALSAIPMVNGQFAPENFDGVYRLARCFHASGCLPPGVQTVEQVFLVLASGMEIGLSPTWALRNVMIVNGRPTVWGDAVIGLVRSSAKCKRVEEWREGSLEDETLVAICECERFDQAGVIRAQFSVADAKYAGLWGKRGPWTSYPARMLQMRARAFCCRDAFADVLGGMDVAEEVADIRTTFDPAQMDRTSADEITQLLDES